MKTFKFLIISSLLTASVFLSACNTVAPQESGLPVVIATETFLGDIAQNIAGNRIKVETLLPLTVDPHEFQPTPQDVTKLAKAQVIIVNGLGYETWFQKTLASLPGQPQIIVTTNGLTAAKDPSGAHPEGDPHMWMDPLKVINYVYQIRDGLSLADPAGKDIYTKNADAYIIKLHTLDQWVREQVKPVPENQRLLVTNHDALGYYANAYGFTIIGAVIPSVTTDASPSAQEIAGLIDTIKTTGAKAIFLDIGENQKLAQQVASETGVKVITGLYVETISAPDGPAPTYIEMIKADTTLIISGLK